MDFIRRRKVIFAIIATAVVMDLLASVIYAAGTFTVNSCSGWYGTVPNYDCTFIQHYFGFYNLGTNPFIDPVSLIGHLIRIFSPTSYSLACP